MLRLIGCLWLCTCINLSAQNFEPPEYKTTEDYAAHEADVLTAIDWLQENTIDHLDRQKANAYVLLWIEGSPKVTVELEAFVMPLTDNNPDLMMLYIGAWVKYALEAGEDYAVEEARLQALQAIITYYQAEKGTRKDSDLDKAVKMAERDKLDKWLEQQLKG